MPGIFAEGELITKSCFPTNSIAYLSVLSRELAEQGGMQTQKSIGSGKDFSLNQKVGRYWRTVVRGWRSVSQQEDRYDEVTQSIPLLKRGGVTQGEVEDRAIDGIMEVFLNVEGVSLFERGGVAVAHQAGSSFLPRPAGFTCGGVKTGT
jgi:hypothetical protein